MAVPYQRVQAFFVPLACMILGYKFTILYTVFMGLEDGSIDQCAQIGHANHSHIIDLFILNRKLMCANAAAMALPAKFIN